MRKKKSWLRLICLGFFKKVGFFGLFLHRAELRLILTCGNCFEKDVS